jgi:hypothetical protein
MKEHGWTLTASALAMCTWTGCGGSTAGLPAAPDGGSDGEALDGAAAPALDGSADASTPFNPGMLGGLVNADGGAIEIGDAATRAAQADGCTKLCTAEAAASCPASGSLSSCVVGCQLLVGNPNCSTATQNLFSCVDGQTATCDTSGNATFAQCGVEELESEACFLQNTADPSLQGPCSTYCAGVAAAACPNDNPSGCQTGCQVTGNLVSGCGPSWTAYVTCAGTSTFACGNDGKAAATGCTAQALSFFICAASGVAPLTSDAGG